MLEERALDVLRKYFGYEKFRSGQHEIVTSIVAGQDTLALLPTGGGKSLCFQVPGLVLGGTTLVISPLISLMKDQVDALTKRGIRACFLNSSLSPAELAENLQTLSRGEFDFVYCAPERLTSQTFIAACQAATIPLLAIDEAHCISQWGHHFRPEYREIADFVSKLKRKPTIAAFTATATARVQTDIINSLKMKNAKVFAQSFYRHNLQLQVIATASRSYKDFLLLWLLQNHQDQVGIIYASTRETTEYLVELIQSLLPDFKSGVRSYHGGMTAEKRAEVQEAFLRDHIKVVVATNAFGMGIDKSNVRFVIHYQVSAHLENYYQEAGRGGRDGQPSKCYLLFYPPDLKLHQEMIASSFTNQSSEQRLFQEAQLTAIALYAETKICRNVFILEYFNELNHFKRCHNCDNCQETKISPDPTSRQRYQFLQTKIKNLSLKTGIPPANIIGPAQLHYFVMLQPQTKSDFLLIPGIGNGWVNKWGNYFAAWLEIN